MIGFSFLAHTESAISDDTIEEITVYGTVFVAGSPLDLDALSSQYGASIHTSL